MPLVDDLGLLDDEQAPPQPRLVDDLGLLDSPEPEQPGLAQRLMSGAGAAASSLGHMVAHPLEAAQYAYEHPAETGALAARVGVPMVGAIGGGLFGPVGAAAGGAAGGAAGERLAQYIEGQPADWVDVGLGAAGGAFVPGKVAGGLLRTAAVRGAQGAALGGGTEALRDLAHGREIQPERVAAGALGGGLIGGVLGGVEGFGNRAPQLVDDLGLLDDGLTQGKLPPGVLTPYEPGAFSLEPPKSGPYPMTGQLVDDLGLLDTPAPPPPDSNVMLRELAPEAAPAPEPPVQQAQLPVQQPAIHPQDSLARFAPEGRVYRETDLEGIVRLLEGGNHGGWGMHVGPGGREEVYLASHPDLALGQGQNRGALVELDAASLRGQRPPEQNRKPGMAFVESQGGGQELLGRENSPSDYLGAMQRISFNKQLLTGRDFGARRLQRMFSEGENPRWTVREEGDQIVIEPRRASPATSNVDPIQSTPDVAQPAAVSPEIEQLQARYDAVKAKLDALGPEPHKPSPEARFFGKLGREGHPPDVVAQYDAEVRAYGAWRRKYSQLKKAEVAASNDLFYAQRGADQPPQPRSALDILRNERGAVETPGQGVNTLRDIFTTYRASKQQAQQDAAAEAAKAQDWQQYREKMLGEIPSLNDRALAEALPGNAKPVGLRSQVLARDLNGNPMRRAGSLSAADPDQLPVSMTSNLPPGVANVRTAAAQANAGEYEYARRGVVPVEQSLAAGKSLADTTRELADRINLTPEETARVLRKRGEAPNVEAMAALVNLGDRQAQQAATAIIRGNAQKIHESLAGMIEFDLQVAGASSELGRALGLLGHLKGPRQNMRKAVNVALRQNLTPEKMNRVREALAQIDPTDTVALNQFLRNVVKPAKLSDKALEWWINWGLLSGTKTQAANIAGNFLMLAERPVTRVASAGFDALRGGARERYFGEAVADSLGMAFGMKEGLAKAWQTLKTEMPSEAANKVYEFRGSGNTGAVKGSLGRVARVWGTSLQATDEFFKAVAGQGELWAEAYRIAHKQGLRGAKAAERMADIVGRPGQINGLIDRMAEEARYRTFSNTPPSDSTRGKLMEGMMKTRDAHPTLKVLFPFLRVPINIAYAGAYERTPVALADVLVRGLKGTLAESRGQVADEVARAALGTAMAMGVATLIMEGKMTGGGPRDPIERAGWRQNNEPYSVKVGDKWVSYARLEPYATALGLVADGFDIANTQYAGDPWDYAGKAGKAFAISLGVNLSNKTFLRGISDMMSAVNDPDRYGDNWLRGLGGTLVPNILAQGARAYDPTVRRPGNMQETWLSRIPGESDQLLPMRDIWGQPISRYGLYDGSEPLAGFVERMASPVEVRRVTDDPATVEVAKHRIGPSAIDYTMSVGGKARLLTAQQVDRLTELRGGLAKKEVERLIGTPRYRNAEPTAQRELLHDAFIRANQRARQLLRSELPRRGMDLPLKHPKPNVMIEGPIN